MVNKVLLIGNLGRDPEIKKLDSGQVVAKFSIATSESYKDQSGEWQEKTEWHNVVAWGKLAERSATLSKGDTIYVEGKLTHRKYQDGEGHNRYATEVVASYFRSLKTGKRDTGTLDRDPIKVETTAANNDDLPF